MRRTSRSSGTVDDLEAVFRRITAARGHECGVELKDFTRLQATVTHVITQDDHVRYYRLCEHCERQVMVIGGAVTQSPRTMRVMSTSKTRSGGGSVARSIVALPRTTAA